MKFHLDDNLINYMKSQNQHDLILYISCRNTCGGTMKEVSARFAGKNIIDFESKGYTRGESELGFVYYKAEEIDFGSNPRLKLINLLLKKDILTLGMRPAGYH